MSLFLKSAVIATTAEDTSLSFMVSSITDHGDFHVAFANSTEQRHLPGHSYHHLSQTSAWSLVAAWPAEINMVPGCSIIMDPDMDL